jgi:hypothetical protein
MGNKANKPSMTYNVHVYIYMYIHKKYKYIYTSSVNIALKSRRIHVKNRIHGVF